MTGRKPTPITVAGKYHRSNDELEDRFEHEPKGCSDALEPPSTLSKRAKAEWKRLVVLYRQLEQPILNDLDLGVLAAYCEARAVFIEAEAQYKKNPELFVFTDKGPVTNPCITLMEKQGQLIAKYGEQLALSPVGRARFGIAKAKQEAQDDPMNALLARGRA